MAPSPVCGMKMRNLLTAVILGLLAVVHTAPVDTVTQNPNHTENDIQEDGFIMVNPASLTTESPKRNTTVHASQQPSPDFEGSATEEISDMSTTSVVFLPESDNYATTTQSSPHTVFSRGTSDLSSDSSTSQSPESGFLSSSQPNEVQSSVTPDHISVSQTTDPAFTSYDLLGSLTSGSGYGSGDGPDTSDITSPSMTSSSNTETTTVSSTSTTVLTRVKDEGFYGSGSAETSTASSTSTAALIRVKEVEILSSGILRLGEGIPDLSITQSPESVSESEQNHLAEEESIVVSSGPEARIVEPINSTKENGTPGWIIITGFIVGVIALVVICVAIATREKWNGPSQVAQRKDRADSSNQQRELEMETFLHKDKPKENGQATEYTVIPLDEFPENYSSH